MEGDVVVEQLIEILKSKRVTHTIINDIPLFYTNANNSSAYVLMNKIQQGLQNEKEIKMFKYHFVDPNPFQPKYGKKLKNNSLFFQSPKETIPFQPMPNCGSIILWIKAQ